MVGDQEVVPIILEGTQFVFQVAGRTRKWRIRCERRESTLKHRHFF